MTGYLTPEDFNPRSYKRSDYDGYHRALHPQISIHAPTRGATVNTYQKMNDIEFQSTLLQEERQVSVEAIKDHGYISIHAPTRGATRTDGTEKLWDFYFNPRSYKRSDYSPD